METKSLKYLIKSADLATISTHLSACNFDFVPPLENTVTILTYSEKIAKNATTFEAWAEETLVGLVAAYNNDEQSLCAYITNVSVLKNYSGKGIAKHLLNNCITFCKEKKYKEVRLEVNKSNRKAIKLYENLNFTIEAELINNIMMKLLL